MSGWVFLALYKVVLKQFEKKRPVKFGKEILFGVPFVTHTCMLDCSKSRPGIAFIFVGSRYFQC